MAKIPGTNLTLDRGEDGSIHLGGDRVGRLRAGSKWHEVADFALTQLEEPVEEPVEKAQEKPAAGTARKKTRPERKATGS